MCVKFLLFKQLQCVVLTVGLGLLKHDGGPGKTVEGFLVWYESYMLETEG